MISALGSLVVELRDDSGVDAIVDGRVRGEDPRGTVMQAGVEVPGDMRGPGSYVAFVQVQTLATPRDRRVPVQRPRFNVRCWGRTREEAMALYIACSDAVHDRGPRVRVSNGFGIYVSHDDTGAQPGKDPDTQQPYVDFVVELIATTQAVA